MARPRSEDKRKAIMSAATRVIAAQGLAAPTATIAKEAGVSNGSLFTYFETKAELLNQLYLELKTEMAVLSMDGMPDDGDIRAQMAHIWSQRLKWAVSHPEKRRTLSQLAVSDDITPQSRQSGHETMAPMADLLERCRANGPMRDAPLAFVVTLMTALTEATMDFMIREPENADEHASTAFDAMWRITA